MKLAHISRIVIGAVALHSLTLGGLLLFMPVAILHRLGWPYEGSIFFPAQSGVFLLILGAAYVGAVRHRAFAWLLVGSKAAAVAFLLAHAWLGTAPPGLLLLAALADSLMGAAVAVVLVAGRRAAR
jgi:hypothetical protein